MMRRCTLLRHAFSALSVVAFVCPVVYGAQNVTLRNGAEFLCAHQEAVGDRIRLYLYPTTAAASSDANYIDVAAASVVSIETVPDPVVLAPPPAQTTGAHTPHSSDSIPLTGAATRELLARAGHAHNIDTDLLASVVHAESNGNPRAVSRAGARGLMQLMPATAVNLGVENSFAPEENVNGGTAYLDQLLMRYHDNIALALAAYNAGPEAVDRYRGIPPYAETRAYVARIIREYNRRKLAARAAQAASIH